VGGHFDAVGFGDPTLGYQATREYLRAAVEEGRRVAEVDEFMYYELETPEGCGLVAATDAAGFLLNGCPYFRGQYAQFVQIESLTPWEAAEPHQGGAYATLAASSDGSPGPSIVFALPRFAAQGAANILGQQQFNLVGLGYRASTHASDRQLPPDGRPTRYFRPVHRLQDLPPIRRCNVECRGQIERATFLTNSRTGGRLAYAQLDCEEARLEVILDLPSLHGGLAEGAFLTGSFWLVGRLVESSEQGDDGEHNQA
jgi:hypothetical protein